MARKSKIETEKQADGQGPVASAGRIAADPKATGAAMKKKKAAQKKKTVRARRSATSKTASSPSSVREPSDEEIRIRAYFIAERRIQLSLEGDSAHDWIEAKRQLIEEAGPASS